MSVGVGVSVHVMTCYALARFGTEQQRAEFCCPAMIAGDQLGAYALSEPQAGSDIAGITTRAKTADEGYALTGTKAWVTHGSKADFYTTFVRTGEHRTRGLSCFLVPGDAPGLTFGAPETQDGTHRLADDRAVLRHRAGGRGSADRRRGRGHADRAVGAGLGPVGHRRLRDRTGPGGAGLRGRLRAPGGEQFGQSIAEFQGIQFLLAEMAAAVDTARATYLMAARKRDAGRPFTRDAAVAKMTATDTAMRVTTDAVQVLGGYGYTRDFPAERYLREAKVTQIFEGTNQIQRLVIARQLLRGPQR